jgi:hypothetical protein
MKYKKLKYKNKEYIYGFVKKRDYPVRGKQSILFYIKMKIGIIPFTDHRVIIKYPINRESIKIYHNKELLKKIIDKYTIKSRKKKLNKLKNLKN